MSTATQVIVAQLLFKRISKWRQRRKTFRFPSYFFMHFFQCSVALTKNITFLFLSLNAFLRSGFIIVVIHFSLFPCGKRRHKIKPSIVNDDMLFLVPEFRYA